MFSSAESFQRSRSTSSTSINKSNYDMVNRKPTWKVASVNGECRSLRALVGRRTNCGRFIVTQPSSLYSEAYNTPVVSFAFFSADICVLQESPIFKE